MRRPNTKRGGSASPRVASTNDVADGWLLELDPRPLERLQKAGRASRRIPISYLAWRCETKGPVQGYIVTRHSRGGDAGDWRRALDGYEHVLRAHEEVITEEDEDFPMDDGIKIHEGPRRFASMPKQQAAKGCCNVYWN